MGEKLPYAQDILVLGARKLGSNEAGEIYSKDLHPAHKADLKALPSQLLQLIGPNAPEGNRFRRGLYLKLTRNEPNPLPIASKPSSAFLFFDKSQKLKLDYLIESPTFVRGDHPVHHTYLTEFDKERNNERYHPANLFHYTSLWSGHVAQLLPPFSSVYYQHVLLLDKFDSHFSKLEPLEQMVIQGLHENGIVPITARGHIIGENIP